MHSQQFCITATPFISLESPQIFTTAGAAFSSRQTLVLCSLFPQIPRCSHSTGLGISPRQLSGGLLSVSECIFPAAPYLMYLTWQLWQAQSQQMAMYGQLNIQAYIKSPIYLWIHKHLYFYLLTVIYALWFGHADIKRVPSPQPRHPAEQSHQEAKMRTAAASPMGSLCSRTV